MWARSRFREMAVSSMRKTTILSNEGGKTMGQVVDLARRTKRGQSNKMRSHAPGRPKTAELRTREYLLPDEVKSMVAHAGTHVEWV